ncbi:putative dna repair protein rhp26 [Phaeomoniella chlamydospora]|uniref:Putative dna repair protein rhp26 n=1 Tax=Phaeomoniella chlamydospora TaxID=158046 RepID=A0A0G2GF25_PHACM|nr:putative dna repair protein rhp26 [Phaeomoniella chlamydospora]
MDGVGESSAAPSQQDDGTASPQVDREPLLKTEDKDESSRLEALGAGIRDQDDLERDINQQASRLLLEQANERDLQRLEKTSTHRDKLVAQIRKLKQRVSQPIGVTQRAKLKADIDRFEGQVKELENDLAQIQARIDERSVEEEHADGNNATHSGRLPHESQRDYLIRTGKITPFSKFGLNTITRSASNLQDALLDAEAEPEDDEEMYEDAGGAQKSHRHLTKPGFVDNGASSDSDYVEEEDVRRHRKRLRTDGPEGRQPKESKPILDREGEVITPNVEDDSEDAYVAEDYAEIDETEDDFPSTRPTKTTTAKAKEHGNEIEDLSGIDDGRESVYLARVKAWSARRAAARRRADKRRADEDEDGEAAAGDVEIDVDPEAEAFNPHPTIPDTVLEGGYRIPGDIYPSLFDYQKTGVQWLWELCSQQVGGIVGDEMGLGKTIQIISFLAGLHHSKKIRKPTIVVCPATVMKQWVNEFHRWWPPFRVTILHSSGSGMINVRNESTREENLLNQMWNPTSQTRVLTSTQRAAEKMLKNTLTAGGVLVTTYSGLQTYAPLLIPVTWEYAILDEGHKIRNPNTAITIYCKELRTPNRIILSGTPMQNNLIELWSLFDFVFPMRLGTLVSFRNQFEIPIKQGGYANASNLQVQTALKCAETLKDAISPYLLQRFKVDVAADLPKKSEQVLFCRLTKIQRQAYEQFLASDDMKSIMAGKRQVLFGVDILRKISNHPDLTAHKLLSVKPGYNYGSANKSGKMQVVGSLLELWRDTGHKTLLFAQHRIMLDILEKFVRSSGGFKYRRMDGNTPIQARQNMVDEFNNDPDLHVFLLTTKVGGLGVNLTGADRVIIFDPDWNPSTDLQARERAWRLGQKREVTIYRLMTAGTIEEKIYHRQIFKQFLTNKILRDPKQRQTFHMSDLHDLFSLGDEQGPTETSTLFKDAEVTYGKGETTTSSRKGKESETAQATALKSDNINSVAGVASVEQFADANDQSDPQTDPSATANQNHTDSSNSSKSESHIMSSIFSRAGIHSAVEHDQIINGRKVVTADPRMIEAEARKVANEAANELRRAGQIARTVPIGTPTWTGQFGISGKPVEETTPARAFNSSTATSRGNHPAGSTLSSSSLLANLAGNHTAQPHRSPRPSTTASSSPLPSRSSTPHNANPNPNPSSSTRRQTHSFPTLIRDYLLTHGGSVYTQMLIDHFNRFCNTPQATIEFKETLKVVAKLDKGPAGRGRGKWVLKDEFR